jgi:hypothetical protein
LSVAGPSSALVVSRQNIVIFRLGKLLVDDRVRHPLEVTQIEAVKHQSFSHVPQQSTRKSLPIAISLADIEAQLYLPLDYEVIGDASGGQH